MVTYDGDSSQPDTRSGFISGYLCNTDHKVIGLDYLWLALVSVFLGMAMSLVMRIHLIWPGAPIPFLSALGDTQERYATLPLLHGSLMVFFVLTAAPQLGFGNYLLPLQIGAREMAFPVLNLCSFWASVVSLFGMTAAFLAAPQVGITIWIASVGIFLAAALCSAINFSVTAIDLRAKGMTLPRMPLTVWAWLVNAILGMLIFSILLASCAGLLSDRLLGTHFFSATNFLASQPATIAADPLPVLWQRLFWFFAQAEVYIAMLPCFGIVSHLIATLSRRPVWKERLVVLALCAVGLVGFCVWGQHMFSSGLNPFSPLVFSALAASLGVPAAILVVSWFATLWKSRIQLNTSLLFALGFVSLFLSGGLSGIFLARRELNLIARSEDFVAGHFHLVMGVAATFAILAALFFWFPRLFGRSLNEPLGKTHFWLTFAGVYCVFMPMHWMGLVSQSAKNGGADLSSVASWIGPARSFITAGILFTVFAQGIFLFNFLWSLLRGERIKENNPWRATTLEWGVASSAPGDVGGRKPAVYRGAYEFGVPGAAEDFIPQDLAPDRVTKAN
ncbi:MAG TPA: cbb3-type cytochrome c oxidase subunit I [Candidatus Acidoferrum sp.]|nr:cbb3-type cytochrome c oxidase subunit I [Candidatus Acidoferrum sp.]